MAAAGSAKQVSSIRPRAAVRDNPHHLRLYLNRMQNDTTSHDVTFLVEGERFPAHRYLVSVASPVLRCMLRNGMKETEQEEIELKEVDSGAWKSTVDYIYSAQIDLVDVDTALKVLECSRRFEIAELEQTVCEYLTEELARSNCCQILSFADRYGVSELRKKAFDEVAKNFHYICRTQAFTKLTNVVVCDILKYRNLVVCGEIDVFLGAMHWLLSPNDSEVHDKVQTTIAEQAYELLEEVDLEIDGFNEEKFGMLRIMQDHNELLDYVDVDNLSNVDNRRIARFLREFYEEVETVHNLRIIYIREQARDFVDKYILSPSLASCTPLRPRDRLLRNRYSEAVTFRHRFHGIQQLLGPDEWGSVRKSSVFDDRNHDTKWWLRVCFRGHSQNERDKFVSCFVYSKCTNSNWMDSEVTVQLFVVTSSNDDPIEAPEFNGNLNTRTVRGFRDGRGFKRTVTREKIEGKDSIAVGFTMNFVEK